MLSVRHVLTVRLLEHSVPHIPVVLRVVVHLRLMLLIEHLSVVLVAEVAVLLVHLTELWKLA